MKLVGTSLSEKVRSAVAAFKAIAGPDAHCFVIVEVRCEPQRELDATHEKDIDSSHFRSFLVKRVYTGRHQNLSSEWSVVVGFDLAHRGAGLTSYCVNYETETHVTVRHSLPLGMNHPYEGVFDLKRLPIGVPQ